jgi:hypothetical protein
LDGGRDGAVASAGGRLLTEEIISLNGHPGRELNVEVLGGEGRYRARMYLVGRRLYVISWMGPTEKAFLRTHEEFLNSFELLEK